MTQNSKSAQPVLEDFLALLEEIQSAANADGVASALRQGLHRLHGVEYISVKLIDRQPGGVWLDNDLPAPAGSHGLDASYPIKAGSSFHGVLTVRVADREVLPDYNHLFTAAAGTAALQLAHLQLQASTASLDEKPEAEGIASANELDTGQAAEHPSTSDTNGALTSHGFVGSAAMNTTAGIREYLYHLITQYTSDSIWALDANLKFTFLSPSTEQLFGYTFKEWENLDWTKFVHPNDIDEINEMYAGFIAGTDRNSHSETIRVYHRNGQERWVEFTASPVFDQAGTLLAVVGVTRDITNRKHTEDALERRVLALTMPLDDPEGLSFEDLLNIDEIQALQDEFAAATGVASIITHPDGTPITRPSRFTRICNEIIRKTEKGCANCYKSDAILGAPHPDGPIVQPCLSGGLWDAGASISVGGRHIANWLIGQVRDDTQKEDAILAYANVIGADQTEMLKAFREVPSMSREQFEKVAQALFTLANQLSTMAYQNIQQARFISERKQSEEQLRASEQALRSLIEAIPDLVMRFDMEGRHLFVSDNISEIWEFKAEDIVGKTHRELGFPEEFCEFWWQLVRKAVESGQMVENELEIEGINGLTNFNWRLIPEKDDKGNVQSLLTMTRDVTAQRKAERDYQILFREMYEGFILLKTIENDAGYPVDFHFLAINPSFERMTGINAGDMIGQGVRSIMQPGSLSNWDVLVRVAQTGTPEHFSSQNREKDTFFEITAFRPAPGQIACILIDVTARKQAEADRLKLERQIQHAQKLESLGVLAGGIAHDFNNILFAILGNASMSLEMLPEDHPVRSMIEEISVSGERASGLVRRILTFARRTERQRTNIDIVPLVKEVTKLMRATLPSNVAIDLELETPITTIFADVSEIQQILMNLCTNAGYVMHAKGGSLIVRLHDHRLVELPFSTPGKAERGQCYIIEVADTGPGIPLEIQERMFDPFFTTKPVGEGTGMGLALVRSITTELGGWIEVDSEIGKGSTFRVFLPLAEIAESDQQPAKRLEVPTGSENVMIVDDEQSIAALLSRYLQKLGYSVSMFTSSIEAAAHFAQHPNDFDLAILDQTMPDLTGKELAAQIKTQRPGLPVIIATGYSSTFTPEQASELGIRHYLDKPIVLSDLALMVRDALDNP